MRSHLLVLAALVPLVAGTALLAGCGPPPEVAPTPGGPLPGQSTPGPPAPPPGQPPFSGSGSAPEGSVAIDCAGQPGDDAVLAVLDDNDMLPDGADATVVEGPLCAGDWQFTVVRVADRDPLQVITSGPPDDLTLVTAGTDVCTIEVRVNAPLGIRAAASCVG